MMYCTTTVFIPIRDPENFIDLKEMKVLEEKEK
ncbi:hypothetical protein FHR92_000984 [Fontibacillus solani]|nr:hypothetical protein [Fontibacillus solani]